MLGIPNILKAIKLWRAASQLDKEIKGAKMEGKKWWTSKSLVSAVTKIAVGIVAILTPETQGHVSAVAGVGLIITGILDGILRAVTNRPLST